MMASKNPIGGKIVKEYLKRFPNTPSLTLAKKIYKENESSFIHIDSVRSIIRYYRGQSGKFIRDKMKDKSMLKAEGSRNPFNLPVSHANLMSLM